MVSVLLDHAFRDDFHAVILGEEINVYFRNKRHKIIDFLVSILEEEALQRSTV